METGLNDSTEMGSERVGKLLPRITRVFIQLQKW